MKRISLFLFLEAAGCSILSTAFAQEVVELAPFSVTGESPAIEQQGLSGDYWRSLGTPGLAEILEESQPGLSLVRRAGMSNDVVLRGLSGEDLSLTIDGRKIHNACVNRMDPPLSHATAEHVQHVEIVAGPFDLRRSGSLGGSINVVSARIAAGPQGMFTFNAGSYDQLHTSGWASIGDATFGVLLQGAYLQSDPYENGDGLLLTEFPSSSASPLDDYLPQYRTNRAYKAWHAGVRARWQLQESLTMIFNGMLREDEGVLFPGLKMDADKTETQQLGFRFQNERPSGGFQKWTADFYYNDTNHLMTDRLRRSSVYGMGMMQRPDFILERGWAMRTDARATNWGATFDAELELSDWGQWSVGAEIGERGWDNRNIIGTINNAMLPDASLQTIGAYAQGRFQPQDDLVLDIGLRLDSFQAKARGDTRFLKSRQGSAQDRDYFKPGAYASLRKELSEHTAIFAGIGSAARAPTPQELYIQVNKPGKMPMSPADWLGNPNLGASRATEITIGSDLTHSDWRFQARAFHIWLQDNIYPVGLSVAGEAPIQTYANLDASLYGVEVSGARHWGEHWKLSTALAWQEGVKRDRPAGVSNDYLAEIPPLRIQSALEYQDEEWHFVFGAMASDSQERIDSDLFEQDLGSWLVLSARVHRRIGESWTLGLAIRNLLDETYALHNSQARNPFSAFSVVDEPGRVFQLSASMRY